MNSDSEAQLAEIHICVICAQLLPGPWCVCGPGCYCRLIELQIERVPDLEATQPARWELPIAQVLREVTTA